MLTLLLTEYVTFRLSFHRELGFVNWIRYLNTFNIFKLQNGASNWFTMNSVFMLLWGNANKWMVKSKFICVVGVIVVYLCRYICFYGAIFLIWWRQSWVLLVFEFAQRDVVEFCKRGYYQLTLQQIRSFGWNVAALLLPPFDSLVLALPFSCTLLIMIHDPFIFLPLAFPCKKKTYIYR